MARLLSNVTGIEVSCQGISAKHIVGITFPLHCGLGFPGRCLLKTPANCGWSYFKIDHTKVCPAKFTWTIQQTKKMCIL